MALSDVRVNPDVVSAGGLTGPSAVDVAFQVSQQTLGNMLWACYGDQPPIDLYLNGPLDVPQIRLSRLVSRLAELRRRYEAVPVVDCSLLREKIEKECERVAFIGSAKSARRKNETILGPVLPALRQAMSHLETPIDVEITPPVRRYKPGPCPVCGHPGATSSTRPNRRLLRCTNVKCLRTWQESRI